MHDFAGKRQTLAELGRGRPGKSGKCAESAGRVRGEFGESAGRPILKIPRLLKPAPAKSRNVVQIQSGLMHNDHKFKICEETDDNRCKLPLTIFSSLTLAVIYVCFLHTIEPAELTYSQASEVPLRRVTAQRPEAAKQIVLLSYSWSYDNFGGRGRVGHPLPDGETV